MRLTALALLAIVIWPAQGSAAAPVYPWCAHYLGRSGGGHNCGFVSFEQCLATVSGIGGTCQQNPFYAEPQPVPRRKRVQRG